MGGKSSASYSQPAYTVPDMSSQFNTTLQAYKSSMDNTLAISQMALQQNLDSWIQEQESSLPSSSPTQSVSGVDMANVDWKEKQEELKKKMTADYTNQKAKMVGTLDNILSSPLLDNMLPDTTSSSLLSGK